MGLVPVFHCELHNNQQSAGPAAAITLFYALSAENSSIELEEFNRTVQSAKNHKGFNHF